MCARKFPFIAATPYFLQNTNVRCSKILFVWNFVKFLENYGSRSDIGVQLKEQTKDIPSEAYFSNFGKDSAMGKRNI